MRILHINSYYATSPFYRNLFDEQARLGESPVVYLPCGRGFSRTRDELGAYTDVSPIFRRYDRLFFHYKYKKAAADAEARYPEDAYDLLHAHSLFSNGYVAWKLAQRSGKPFVVAVRDTDVNVFFAKMPHLRALGRRILADAARVVFISPAYREQALRPYLSPAEFAQVDQKASVIPNGVDPFWLANLGAAKTTAHQPVRFLLVGQIVPRKNIPTAAKAVALLNEMGCPATLTVVGKPVDAKLAARIAAMPHVTLLPPRPLQALLPLYRDADLFVLPSLRETFGLVYAEALTQGLPVLYTRGQGFDGQFNDGQAGFAVDPRDPGEIAERAQRLLRDYAAVSSRAIALAEPFDWQKIARRYDALYAGMLQKEANPLG